MPSSYSSSLRFELQFTGENLNLWGDKLNAALSRADSSIAGWTTKALTTDYTLTTANGSADEARSAMLKFTGTGSYTVTVPAVSKRYDIWNALTGTLTVSNGSASVTLIAGEVASVMTDGGAAIKRVQPTDFGSSRITSVGTPTATTDAATKAYVDATAFTMAAGGLPGQGGNSGKYLTTDGSALSWGAAPVTSVAALTGAVSATALNTALGARIRLTTDTTFYVATTGNDSNTGLTIGSPWLTLQHATDVIRKNYDLAGYTATVQAADGTYTAGVTLAGLLTGQSASLAFQGNLVTPANCIVSVTNSECFSVSKAADITVQGFKMAATGTSTGQGNGLAAYAATIRFGTVEFGACANAGVFSSNNGLAVNVGNYTISGGGIAHLYANGGQITNGAAITVTVTGTPAFSTAFAFATFTCAIYAVGYTFVGSATGSRYAAQMNGVISTGGGGGSYFPGNSAGSTATGGQYA